MTQFLPCPFCGSNPTVHEVHSTDERRYMQMNVSCCVTMSAGLQYSVYRSMIAIDIEKQIINMLAQKWNTRVEDNPWREARYEFPK
jgi:hypothetical protein